MPFCSHVYCPAESRQGSNLMAHSRQPLLPPQSDVEEQLAPCRTTTAAPGKRLRHPLLALSLQRQDPIDLNDAEGELLVSLTLLSFKSNFCPPNSCEEYKLRRHSFKESLAEAFCK